MMVAICDDQRRVLAEALVACGPTARRGRRRRTARSSTGCRSPRTSAAVASPICSTSAGSRVAPEADVVREDRRAEHVAVPVHGVDAVDHRDPQPGAQRLRLERVDHRRPRPRACSAAASSRRRRAPSPSRHCGDQRRVVGDRAALGLGHLADLLLQRHAAEQVGDPLLDGQRGVAVRRHRDRRAGRGLRCRQQREDEYADGESDATRSAERGREGPCCRMVFKAPPWLGLRTSVSRALAIETAAAAKDSQ